MICGLEVLAIPMKYIKSWQMADPLRDAREDFALEIYKNHGLFFTAINNVFTLL